MDAHFVTPEEMSANSGKNRVVNLLSLTGTAIKCVCALLGWLFPSS